MFSSKLFIILFVLSACINDIFAGNSDKDIQHSTSSSEGETVPLITNDRNVANKKKSEIRRPNRSLKVSGLLRASKNSNGKKDRSPPFKRHNNKVSSSPPLKKHDDGYSSSPSIHSSDFDKSDHPDAKSMNSDDTNSLSGISDTTSGSDITGKKIAPGTLNYHKQGRNEWNEKTNFHQGVWDIYKTSVLSTSVPLLKEQKKEAYSSARKTNKHKIFYNAIQSGEILPGKKTDHKKIQIPKIPGNIFEANMYYAGQKYLIERKRGSNYLLPKRLEKGEFRKLPKDKPRTERKPTLREIVKRPHRVKNPPTTSEESSTN